jgi:hypothetical protein
MAEAPSQIPTGKDPPQQPTYDYRQFLRRYAIAVAVGALILGAVLIRALIFQINGPSSLSGTHYWSDRTVRVRWEWRRSDVRSKEAGVDMTACIARGVIKNLHETQVLNATSVDLILEDSKGLELDSEKRSFGQWRGVNLEPGESKEFTLKYWVATGFLRDVRKLSARLGSSFKTEPAGIRTVSERSPDEDLRSVHEENIKELELPNCEFAFTFPHKCERTDVGQGPRKCISVQSADLLKSPFLRAESIPVSDRHKAVAGFRSTVRKYAERNKLEDISISVSDTDLGKEASFTGNTSISGTRVRVFGKVILGQTSILYLKAAEPAETAPSHQADIFLKSVKKRNNQSTATPSNPITLPPPDDVFAVFDQSSIREGHRVFVSKEFRFIFNYPEGWSPVESPYEGIRFKMVSESGASIAVQVETPPDFDQLSPEQFQRVRASTFDRGETGMDQVIPGAKLLDHGKTTLANLPAYSSLYELPRRSLEQVGSIRQYQVQTVDGGFLYIVTFSVDTTSYVEAFQSFRVAMQGFVIIGASR